jgi:hypothetical protein
MPVAVITEPQLPPSPVALLVSSLAFEIQCRMGAAPPRLRPRPQQHLLVSLSLAFQIQCRAGAAPHLQQLAAICPSPGTGTEAKPVTHASQPQLQPRRVVVQTSSTHDYDQEP